MTDTFIQDVTDVVKVGAAIHFDTGHTKEVLHILAIVDDCMVVNKSWSKRENRWAYEINSMNYFHIMRDFIVELEND